jgi:hypothetical protein
MNPEMTSIDNSRKLDRIIQLIEGEEGAPGILGRLARHDEILYGRDGSSGMVNKVNLMWRAHVYVLCTLSGVVGYFVKSLFH